MHETRPAPNVNTLEEYELALRKYIDFIFQNTESSTRAFVSLEPLRWRFVDESNYVFPFIGRVVVTIRVFQYHEISSVHR